LTSVLTRTLGELAGTGQRIVMGDSSPAVWRGRYDVQLVHEPEMVRTLVKGPLSIEEDVTP
jgi:hypothetical protein